MQEEGLQAGEEVVVRANFLIDAESNLKAALQTFGARAAHRGSGRIAALDAQAGTIELEHEAMPSLGWPAMTMEFGVADRSLLRGLKAGDRVEFELSAKAAGEYVVEQIAPPAKPKPRVLPTASSATSSVTRPRHHAKAITTPITATSTPTVFTSHRSVFGPVTARNDRTWTSGHTPVSV